MKIGALVATKSRWGMDSRNVGIVIEKTSTGDDTWLVLWSLKNSYKIQEHIGEGLVDLSIERRENV